MGQIPASSARGNEWRYSIGYNLNDAHVAVTLYIYNRGQLNIGDNLDGDDILAEWRKVKDAVFEAGRLGFYDSVREEFSGKEHLGKRKDCRKARYCRFG